MSFVAAGNVVVSGDAITCVVACVDDSWYRGFSADGALRSQRMRSGTVQICWVGELRVESMDLSSSYSDLTTSICSSSESASDADCSWIELVSMDVFSLSSTCGVGGVGDELEGRDEAGLIVCDTSPVGTP